MFVNMRALTSEQRLYVERLASEIRFERCPEQNSCQATKNTSTNAAIAHTVFRN